MAQSLRVVDAAAVVAGATAAIWYGAGAIGPAKGSLIAGLAVFGTALFIAFLVVAERLRIYYARRTENLPSELMSLAEAAFYATGIASATTQMIGPGLPGDAYLRALAAAVLVLVSLRFAMRFIVRRFRRRGDDYRVWLIVGFNDRAADLAETILANAHFGIRIEAIVNLPGSGASTEAPARFRSGPLSSVPQRVLAGSEELREIVATHVIDEVVVTLPVRSCYDRIREVLDICCEAGISLKFGPEVFDKPGFHTQVAHVGSIPMVTHYSGPANYRLLMAKRLIDLGGSTLGLLLLAPLLAAIAVLVKATSHGPVFFVQTRVGLHGRRFEMVKFRSMVRDALERREQLAALNERDGTAFKIRNDARVTPVGRWLRKYHLDELPQLWNVFVGDMSLVGPRPLPVSEAFGDEWWQRRRLTMPPGLTCHWQLADDPTMPFRKWMELDMAYIDRWSIWLDLKLIVRTFATVARGRGW